MNLHWIELGGGASVTDLSTFVGTGRPDSAVNQEKSVVLSTSDLLDVLAFEKFKFCRLSHTIEIPQSFEIKTQLALICVTTTPNSHIVRHKERVATASRDIPHVVKRDSLWLVLTVPRTTSTIGKAERTVECLSP